MWTADIGSNENYNAGPRVDNSRLRIPSSEDITKPKGYITMYDFATLLKKYLYNSLDIEVLVITH